MALHYASSQTLDMFLPLEGVNSTTFFTGPDVHDDAGGGGSGGGRGDVWDVKSREHINAGQAHMDKLWILSSPGSCCPITGSFYYHMPYDCHKSCYSRQVFCTMMSWQQDLSKDLSICLHGHLKCLHSLKLRRAADALPDRLACQWSQMTGTGVMGFRMREQHHFNSARVKLHMV